jgi:hypothetical protein
VFSAFAPFIRWFNLLNKQFHDKIGAVGLHLRRNG